MVLVNQGSSGGPAAFEEERRELEELKKRLAHKRARHHAVVQRERIRHAQNRQVETMVHRGYLEAYKEEWESFREKCL